MLILVGWLVFYVISTFVGYLMTNPVYILLGITHLSPHNELVRLPYIAVATYTSSREGGEPLRITEANTIVGLYPYSVFTNPMFLSTNSLSIVYTFS